MYVLSENVSEIEERKKNDKWTHIHMISSIGWIDSKVVQHFSCQGQSQGISLRR